MTLSRVEVKCERARARATRLAQWSAKSTEIAQARAALTEIDQELAVAASPGAADGQPVETTEEHAERHQIGATRQQIANQIEQQSHQLRATLDRLHAALGTMPAAFDVQRLTAAKSAMDQAARAAVAAERTHLDAVRDAEALAGLTLQAAAVARKPASFEARHNYALALAAVGKSAAAREQFEAALAQTAPGSASAAGSGASVTTPAWTSSPAPERRCSRWPTAAW